MATDPTNTVPPALLRSLRTFQGYRRTVPEGSPVYRALHDRGLVQIVGTRYGHGCGRHSSPLWEVAITDAGRVILDEATTAEDARYEACQLGEE